MSRTNYTKFSTKEPRTEPHQVSIDEVAEVEFPYEVKPVHGRVVNCARLNVRKEPNIKSEIVAVIDAETDVEIIEVASTEEFYRVKTSDGVEGFCMKDYVTVLP